MFTYAVEQNLISSMKATVTSNIRTGKITECIV